MRNEPISCVSTAASHCEPSHRMREVKPSPLDLPRTESLAGDIAKPLIAAIAQELWRLRGGNEVLNWLEAEALLQNALAADCSFDRGDRE